MKKLILVIMLVFVLAVSVGCSAGPGTVVEKFFKALEGGEIDEAIGYLSSRAVQTLGADKWRSALAEMSRQIEAEGGMGEVKVLNEIENGDIATVEVELTDNNGNSDTETFNLVKEDGDWKIDIDPFTK